MEITLDFAWLEATMLAGVRMAAFVVIAPPFSYQGFPMRIKAILALGLALAVSPLVTPGYQIQSTGGFFTALVLEVLTGAALGFLVYLVFAAVQTAGALIDLQSGFTMAQAFDPGQNVVGAQYTKLFNMTAIVLMFTSDAYQLIIAGLARSFNALPVGGGLTLDAELLVTGVSQMFLAALQIAGPLVVVLFLADVGLGLLTRVAPQLNAFALGFPLKILITLTMGTFLYLGLPGVVSSLTDRALDLMGGAAGG
ncbi:flagellar biosynthetic protein FliR [Arthrobacter sp. 3Tela_A]|uniref:flagellar biosynthetic protein FliR n=1 Tax=Arthrobacter sp. 3Tela_A TaxID=3093743 RepID=UPI003BB7D015